MERDLADLAGPTPTPAPHPAPHLAPHLAVDLAPPPGHDPAPAPRGGRPRPRWQRDGGKHVSTHAGHRLEVFLKSDPDTGAPLLFSDAWAWRFEVREPGGASVCRGVRETLGDAKAAAWQKAEEVGALFALPLEDAAGH